MTNGKMINPFHLYKQTAISYQSFKASNPTRYLTSMISLIVKCKCVKKLAIFLTYLKIKLNSC